MGPKQIIACLVLVLAVLAYCECAKTFTIQGLANSLYRLPQHRGLRDSEYATIFGMFDKNSNALIEANELMSIASSLGEALTTQEAEAMIAEDDIDGNNAIDFTEFTALMDRRL